jgi:hypothetical protein
MSSSEEAKWADIGWQKLTSSSSRERCEVITQVITPALTENGRFIKIFACVYTKTDQ